MTLQLWLNSKTIDRKCIYPLVTNLSFGGLDEHALFITFSSNLSKVRVQIWVNTTMTYVEILYLANDCY